jgi:hypothetical protein
MRTVTIDESRIAARMRLIDEHLQAEMDLDLDRTMATLNDAPITGLTTTHLVVVRAFGPVTRNCSRAFPTSTLRSRGAT